MSERDIEVGISDDTLTLKGEKRQEREEKAGNSRPVGDQDGD
jgi:HSP20 family molecular chaperone IbpA